MRALTLSRVAPAPQTHCRRAAGGAPVCARGFSLIEVLVSLAVCALFLAVLLPASSAALQRLRLSQLQVQAHALAAQKIELLSAWPAREPVPREGAEGSLRWSVLQTAVDTGAREEGPAASLRQFRIRVEVPGDPSPLVELLVQRLGDLSGLSSPRPRPAP
jgi:prepilin-type N-terminal cleavage/methylation domain-containing protein